MNVLRSKLTELDSCRLTALQLSLGELSGIDRDSLRFALDTLLADADYNGVGIRFEITPATFGCSACNWQGRLESFALTCPECTGQDLDIIAG
jgi:Zn finger protein HypA/HybF involved in hydrogenase expression